jgi:hypothetical protein
MFLVLLRSSGACCTNCKRFYFVPDGLRTACAAPASWGNGAQAAAPQASAAPPPPPPPPPPPKPPPAPPPAEEDDELDVVLAEPERDAAGSDVRPGARSLCTPGAVWVLSQLPRCARAARSGRVACKGVPQVQCQEPCLSMCWDGAGVCLGLRVPLRAYLAAWVWTAQLLVCLRRGLFQVRVVTLNHTHALSSEYVHHTATPEGHTPAPRPLAPALAARQQPHSSLGRPCRRTTASMSC